MSLKHSIAANYCSQLYVAGIGILITPVYLQHLGIEAYGLVGFFAALLTWFQLLDIGLTPSVSREIARYRGGALDAASLRKLLRVVEWLFYIVCTAGAAVIAGMADAIATRWLHAEHIGQADIGSAVTWMGSIAALRLVSSLYRGAIAGFEQFDWLAVFNALIATARALLVLPAFWLWGDSINVFFTVQAVIAALELASLAFKTYGLLPKAQPQSTYAGPPLRQIARFSLGVAFVTSLSVVVSQSDRLILSTLLSLENFSYFSLATLVASSISLIAGPVSSVLAPRMARLVAANDRSTLLDLYRLAIRGICAVILPAAFTIAAHPRAVLWAWTGNAAVAQQAASVLSLYTLGNAAVAIATLPYTLQFALGTLRLHIVGSGCLILMLIPGQIYLTLRFGAVGAGAFWLALNAGYLLAWIPNVHRQLAPEITARKFFSDVAAPASVAALSVLAASLLLNPEALDSRSSAALSLAACATVATLLATVSVFRLRQLLFNRMKPSGSAG